MHLPSRVVIRCQRSGNGAHSTCNETSRCRAGVSTQLIRLYVVSDSSFSTCVYIWRRNPLKRTGWSRDAIACVRVQLNAESIVTVDDVGAHELVQNTDDARVGEQLREISWRPTIGRMTWCVGPYPSAELPLWRAGSAGSDVSLQLAGLLTRYSYLLRSTRSSTAKRSTVL